MANSLTTDHFDVDCPYKDNCESKGVRCGSCRNNKKIKEDHYSPIPFQPYIIPYEQPIYPVRGPMFVSYHYQQ